MVGLYNQGAARKGRPYYEQKFYGTRLTLSEGILRALASDMATAIDEQILCTCGPAYNCPIHLHKPPKDWTEWMMGRGPEPEWHKPKRGWLRKLAERLGL